MEFKFVQKLNSNRILEFKRTRGRNVDKRVETYLKSTVGTARKIVFASICSSPPRPHTRTHMYEQYTFY